MVHSSLWPLWDITSTIQDLVDNKHTRGSGAPGKSTNLVVTSVWSGRIEQAEPSRWNSACFLFNQPFTNVTQEQWESFICLNEMASTSSLMDISICLKTRLTYLNLLAETNHTFTRQESNLLLHISPKLNHMISNFICKWLSVQWYFISKVSIQKFIFM